MKLLIQIPCYNEEQTLPQTLQDIPRQIDGIDEIEILVINDGSTDQTVEAAKENGADHIISNPCNMGLAKTFLTGLDFCIEIGADIIVNTDADNQYRADDIAKLIHPILEKKSEIVVGERPIQAINHFSLTKKFLQKIGSWFVRKVSRTNIPDATSGFRAISKNAAMQLNVFSDYTYTLETIIQAGQKNMPITSVKVNVNDQKRPSRLIKSTSSYITRSLITITRILVVYRPFRFFMTIGTALFISGFMIGARFLYYYFSGQGTGHLQSLLLASILMVIGFQTILAAFVVDLLAVNRQLLEDVQFRLKKQGHEKK